MQASASFAGGAMKISGKRWWFLLLLAGSAGAQDLPAPELVNPARNAASSYAISMDLITHALTRSCAVYGGDALELTRSGRQAWQRRNQPWVDVAHRYLRLIEAGIASSQGPEAGRRFYDERKAELQLKSQAFLERSFPPGSDAFGTCRDLAAEMGTGVFDLGKNPDHAATLRALLMELPPPPK
jgi:hypothetical protein